MPHHPQGDPDGDLRRDFLALLTEVGMIPGRYRPGMSDEDREDVAATRAVAPTKHERDERGRWVAGGGTGTMTKRKFYIGIDDVRAVMADAGKGSAAVHGGWAEFQELAQLRGVPGLGNRQKVALEMLDTITVRESWLLSVLRELDARGALEVRITFPMTREQMDRAADHQLEGPAGDAIPALEMDPDRGPEALLTYGHADRIGYAAAVTAWRRDRWHVEQESGYWSDEPDPVKPSDVRHLYAVQIGDDDGEWMFEWTPEDVDADTPNAFPITLVDFG